jgi:hypothetical protein
VLVTVTASDGSPSGVIPGALPRNLAILQVELLRPFKHVQQLLIGVTAMAHTNVSTKRPGFGETMRPDLWWAQPAFIFIGLSTFVLYSTWAAFQGQHYTYGPYLSPFYSPELFGSSSHAWFGSKPSWWPDFIRFSPALLILWMPAGFRLTCYYYRGAYYKAFWADPPACTVGEPRKTYLGEKSFPLILQNVHRYFVYGAVIFLFLLSYDVWLACWFVDPLTGKKSFGMGLGTLVLAVNVVMLGGYTFGCHSLRHLFGGFMDRLSSSPAKLRLYNCSSCLNRRHMGWAWTSLCTVMFADVYVRLCSMGIWKDIRLF